jgi:hypothetical protein
MTITVPKFDSASSLEELFARLSARSPTSTSPKASPDRLNLPMFSFDNAKVSASCPSEDLSKASIMSDRSEESQAFKQIDREISSTPLLKVPSVTSESSGKALDDTTNLLETTPEKVKEASSRELTEVEREYLRKASEYVSALPTSINTPEHLFKTVSVKLHSTYTPIVKLEPTEIDRLKARYAFAVVNFINQNVNMNVMPLTAHKVKEILQYNDGSFLTLCATLIEESYMTSKNLDHVVGLCKILLDVLPKAIESNENPKSSNDPADKMKLWPAQEKRKGELPHNALPNPVTLDRKNILISPAATYRTCILKGVSGLALSDLTSLIWGGALESLVIAPASDIAIVRFLTPTACTTYLAATSNGVVVPADPSKPSAPRKLIFVEPQPIPDSTNDVIQSCIDAEQTRCVRALGADDDWSDAALMKLALGTDKEKRNVERIKKRKNAKGVSCFSLHLCQLFGLFSVVLIREC